LPSISALAFWSLQIANDPLGAKARHLSVWKGRALGMSLRRDHGHCCFFLHLKLGVGLIAMYVFFYAFVCICSFFAVDLRFQSGGYHASVVYWPQVFNACGLVFGLVGLLGVYDDKAGWAKTFLFYMYGKVAVAFVVFIYDFHALRHCEAWGTGVRVGGPSINADAMQPIATLGVCANARVAYVVGWALEFSLLTYLTYKTYTYITHLDANPSFPISFGDERDSLTRLKEARDENAELDDLEAERQLRQARKNYGAANLTVSI